MNPRIPTRIFFYSLPTFLLILFILLAVPNAVLSEPLYQAVYEYDGRGFVTNLIETYEGAPAQSRVLIYDALGRIVQEDIGEYQALYEYDHLGNRVRHSISGEQHHHYYNDRNELFRQDLPDAVTRTIFYDLNGSLTQKVTGAASTRYEWDSRGRLLQVFTNNLKVFTAKYAGGLKRLSKQEGSKRKVVRHDGATAIQEVDEVGEVKELVRGDRGASTVGGILYSADEEGTNTYTYNGVGSTVALSGEYGSVQIVKYDAFGNVMEGQENVGDERLANTKEFDESIGLYFHGARYYDATIGRYISMDPARDGANHYVYANNAPFTYVDPTGLRSWKIPPGATRTTSGRAVEGFWELFKTADENKLLPVNPGNMVFGYSAAAVGTLGMAGGKSGSKITQWIRRIVGLGAKKNAEQVIRKASMQFKDDVPILPSYLDASKKLADKHFLRETIFVQIPPVGPGTKFNYNAPPFEPAIYQGHGLIPLIKAGQEYTFVNPEGLPDLISFNKSYAHGVLQPPNVWVTTHTDTVLMIDDVPRLLLRNDPSALTDGARTYLPPIEGTGYAYIPNLEIAAAKEIDQILDELGTLPVNFIPPGSSEKWRLGQIIEESGHYDIYSCTVGVPVSHPKGVKYPELPTLEYGVRYPFRY